MKKRYGILDNVKSPADLRNLSYNSLDALSASLREFIVDHVSKTGGHLASNLGVVELAVALEREFDSSKDRIIYDVGHQSYVHKILTDRREGFDSLRQFGGLSGFMKPEESPADPCITGHASSSVSVALGMAHARTLKNQKYHVIAVIGDGAMTGGMAYEALNSAGTSREPLIVVLNDNNMSIARNVGGLNRHLSRLRVNPRYLRAKTRVKGVLSRMPGGQKLADGLSRIKRRLKILLLPTSIFEQMGFAYFGPVDGHDIKSVCELLRMAKKMKKPVLLHIMTRKGKGYTPSEQDPETYHGVSKFNPVTGITGGETKQDFSACFGKELCRLAETDGRICAVTAAMPSGTGLTGFAERYRSRFFDVGIAEEHAVAMAAGMAKQGLLPVCAIYSTFLQRAYDQIIHDVAIEGLHVVLAVDRAGIVGADGATHNGVFDVAFLRSVPGLKIYAPSNFAELRAMLSHALYHDTGAVAIRYPRGGEASFTASTVSEPFVRIKEGKSAAIVTYGTMLEETLQAANTLADTGCEIAVYKWNELSASPGEALLQELGAYRAVLVAEDVVQTGGMGEYLAALLAARSCAPQRLLFCSTGDQFLPHGSVEEVRRACGLDAASLAKTLREAIAK
ncbi:1-deoxy-D-xylulose-5-phosphate synthase [Butyricicoccus faecihominis]|uniref:1-deoxy-D-xylulose-5-phosphate synthase n=1 Tax=Butyricicoccaceae TaxID=3085642 RepID=UPI0024787A91|nr:MULTISPECIES: 1-deoxy-D-xylulose-5-phosphate synthase [Butyricicoccaceae]MCQ5129863.1 1-deoxy-D-xylulose-5-phosphate synthase [Butyricicoccus faecihominis]WNX83005.1 1-deoxy-D-xylulose-5-phosphate synthase [Agathobaculum sp. NTUH-O15-33]